MMAILTGILFLVIGTAACVAYYYIKGNRN